MKFSISEKGVSLYLAVLIMSVLLTLALGISSILIGQIKTMKEMGNSVAAFYAANTGVEKTLYEISKGAGIGSHFEGTLTENGASYIADILAPEGTCPGPNYCIRSVGVL